MTLRRSRRWAGWVAALAILAPTNPTAKPEEPTVGAQETAADGDAISQPPDGDAPSELPVPEPQAPAADAVEPEGEDSAVPPSQDAPAEPQDAIGEPHARRVRVKLDVEGQIFAPAGRDAAPLRRATSLHARFDFRETARSGPAVGTVERSYRDATAELRINEEPMTLALAADARNLLMTLRGATPSPSLREGFLTADETDLLDIPFEPILIDSLLPACEPTISGTWSVPADVAAGLLAIDTLETGGLTATLATVEDGLATVTLEGVVEGGADGVPTHLVVEAECTMAARATGSDEAAGWRLTGPISQLSATIRERRQAGHVAPGFDVEANIVVSRVEATPGESDATPGESDTAPAAAPRPGGAGRPGVVWHRDPAGRYHLICDARWRVVEDGAAGLVLRLIDHGALVGQASITALPRADALAPPTVAEVQRDVEASLAGQFGAFVAADETVRADGVRVVRVVSKGVAESLPFLWIHRVLTDPTGRRAAVTCMHEASLTERFGRADFDLVEGVGFVAGPETPRAGHSRPDREARRP